VAPIDERKLNDFMLVPAMIDQDDVTSSLVFLFLLADRHLTAGSGQREVRRASA
jgi:hypothetical protein